jgi:hypothetical protein
LRGWLIEKLKQVRVEFKNNTYKSLLLQKSLKIYYNLLKENDVILDGKTTLTRSRRQRARNIFTEVFRLFGPKVFLLYILAVPIIKLYKIKFKDILADI